MGTTVTTNLGLIKPDVNESIKATGPFVGWSAQNAANMDMIDSLFRFNNTTYALTWGATTTPPTLGTGGFAEGKFVRLHPRMVVVFFRLFCGTAGFVAGSGTYSLNLPVAIDPSFSVFTDTLPIGKMIYQDNSAVLTSSAFGLVYNVPNNFITARPSEGGTWTAAAPVVPANNDRYSGFFMYPTAAA